MSKIVVVVLFVMFFIYSCNCNCDRKEDELLSLVVIFRHGDKTPKEEYFEVYPKNPWSSPKLWNYTDLGGLTQKGKQNSYERGKWLRKRYEHFLPDHYTSKNILVNSSDSDRVLISTQLLLCGLMPPKGRDVWNSQLPWQPIPIHTKPEHQDNVLSQKAHCGRFEELVANEIGQEPDLFSDLAYLKKFTGMQITRVKEITNLYKLLCIVEDNGMALPNWAQVALPKLKEKLDAFYEKHADTDNMKRLMSGPFLHLLLTQFDGVLMKPPTTPKLLILGAHSRTLLNVIGVLDTYKGQPSYTATIMFELKKNCNGHVVIEVHYQTAPTGTPMEIIRAMPYSVFKQRYKHFAIDPETWNWECRTWFSWLRWW